MEVRCVPCMMPLGCVSDKLKAALHAKIWGKSVHSGSLEKHVCLPSSAQDREKVMLERI